MESCLKRKNFMVPAEGIPYNYNCSVPKLFVIGIFFQVPLLLDFTEL